jgi:hypothetical protein
MEIESACLYVSAQHGSREAERGSRGEGRAGERRPSSGQELLVQASKAGGSKQSREGGRQAYNGGTGRCRAEAWDMREAQSQG